MKTYRSAPVYNMQRTFSHRTFISHVDFLGDQVYLARDRIHGRARMHDSIPLNHVGFSICNTACYRNLFQSSSFLTMADRQVVSTITDRPAEVVVLERKFTYLVGIIDVASLLPEALREGLVTPLQSSECSGKFHQAEKFLGYLQKAVNEDMEKFNTFLQVLHRAGQESIAALLRGSHKLYNTCVLHNKLKYITLDHSYLQIFAASMRICIAIAGSCCMFIVSASDVVTVMSNFGTV